MALLVPVAFPSRATAPVVLKVAQLKSKPVPLPVVPVILRVPVPALRFVMALKKVALPVPVANPNKDTLPVELMAVLAEALPKDNPIPRAVMPVILRVPLMTLKLSAPVIRIPDPTPVELPNNETVPAVFKVLLLK